MRRELPALTDAAQEGVHGLGDHRIFRASSPQFSAHRAGRNAAHPFTLIALLGVTLVTLQISWALQKAIERAAKARKVAGQEGSVRVAQRLTHYVVLSIGTVIALQSLGIDLGSLVAAGAVFAVGVGLAMQGLAQNFVSGIILLVERSIKPGDIIEVESATVRVLEMGIRSTVCRTREGSDLIVPNSLLVQSTVRNLTKDDADIRVRCAVGVAYGSDLAQVQRVLLECVDGLSWRHRATETQVFWRGFGSSSVDWEICVWAKDPWELPVLRTELAMAVWTALKQANITIAYPQLDVHFDAPPSSLEGVMPALSTTESAN